MRASVDQIRDKTLDAIDTARDQAAGLVGSGAGLLTAGIDAQADRLASGIEVLVEHAPAVSVEVARRRCRRPLVVIVVVLVLGAVAFSLARRRGAGAGAGPSEPPAPVPAPA